MEYEQTVENVTFCEVNTIRTLAQFDRGARTVSAVMWKVANIKTIIFEDTEVIFYLEDEPIRWSVLNQNWLGYH